MFNSDAKLSTAADADFREMADFALDFYSNITREDIQDYLDALKRFSEEN